MSLMMPFTKQISKSAPHTLTTMRTHTYCTSGRSSVRFIPLWTFNEATYQRWCYYCKACIISAEVQWTVVQDSKNTQKFIENLHFFRGLTFSKGSMSTLLREFSYYATSMTPAENKYTLSQFRTEGQIALLLYFQLFSNPLFCFYFLDLPDVMPEVERGLFFDLIF